MNFPRAKIARMLVAFFDRDDRRIEHAFKVLFYSEKLLEGRTDCLGSALVIGHGGKSSLPIRCVPGRG
ncbi:MAG: hypothetical protein AAB215_07990 [Planctomycetota bacterium]